MFVWSIKTTRPRLAVYGAVLGLLVTAMAVGGRQPMRMQGVSADGEDAVRVSYLQTQGYEVDPQWTDVREVTAPNTATVPVTYRGKRLKCFNYAVAGEDTVCLYEYNGKIIGAYPME